MNGAKSILNWNYEPRIDPYLRDASYLTNPNVRSRLRPLAGQDPKKGTPQLTEFGEVGREVRKYSRVISRMRRIADLDWTASPDVLARSHQIRGISGFAVWFGGGPVHHNDPPGRGEDALRRAL